MAIVVIEQKQTGQYESLGYRRASSSAREVMGEQTWIQMPADIREFLVVMELSDAKKEAFDSLPIGYVLDMKERPFISAAYATKVDVQERGKYDCIVADSAGARQVSTSDLKATSRDAVLQYRTALLGAIRDHRSAIADLEELLRRHECL